jgi:hypothetical protein
MSDDIDVSVWYKCDPEKNKKCRRQGCKYRDNKKDYDTCEYTNNPAYSIDGVKYHVVKTKKGGKVKFILRPLK